MPSLIQDLQSWIVCHLLSITYTSKSMPLPTRLPLLPLSLQHPLQIPLHRRSRYHLPPHLPNILTTQLPLPPILLPLPLHTPSHDPRFPLLLTHETPVRAHAPPEIRPFLRTATELAVPVERGELAAERGAVEGCVEGCAAGQGCGVDI